MPSLWSKAKHTAGYIANRTPGVSNVMGVVRGDPYQAVGGAHYVMHRDLGRALAPTKLDTRGLDTPGMYEQAPPRNMGNLAEAKRRPQLGDAFDDPGTSVFSGIDDYKTVFPKITGEQRMVRGREMLAPHMEAIGTVLSSRRKPVKPEEMP